MNQLPPNQLIADVRVPVPEELIALKLLALAGRTGQPKADSDRRDIKMLLLEFPALKAGEGPVLDRLLAADGDERALAEWREIISTDFEPPADEEW